MSNKNNRSNRPTTLAAALIAAAATTPQEPTEQTPPEALPVEQPELKTPEELALAEAKGAGYETVELYLAAKKDADATFTKPTKVDRWPDRTRKSTVSGPVKLVWHIADAMIAENPDVRRKDVVAAAIKEGVAGYTAKTQYQAWYTARRESQKAAAEVAAKMAAKQA